jgi:6-pyruvoyltetrahydropterin/6-carboxytetrahydropterin synthase
MKIARRFTFEASHFLSSMPQGHQCLRQHGHRYELTVYLSSHVNQATGMVMDFAVLKDIVTENVLKTLDHRNLNEISGLSPSSVENLARWIWTALSPVLPALCKVQLYETENCFCEYEGE